jgi:hypothetical protein
MIISHSHRFIFIKSAKTAGTSVEAALSGFCGGNDVVTPLGPYGVNRDKAGKWVHSAMNAGDFQQHDHGRTIRDKVPDEVWSRYFKFSIARNPWDRALSLFFWKYRNDPALKTRRRFYHHLGISFDEFRGAKSLFSRFVREGDWQTNDRFYLIDGELCVDFIVRYENLTHDLNRVCESVGLPPVELPHLKSGIRSQGHHYSAYYDAQSRDTVADRHRNDIRLFGYRFEET